MLHIDTGNTAFMLVCSSLVMLMTPGLAFFYGGLVSHRNVLTIMMQSFASMAWTTVIWFVCGYSLCFSGDVHGIIGNFHMAFLHGIGLNTPSPTPGIPLLVHVVYQLMFAVITPALITGAFANRVSFKAYMAFLTLWLFLVYFPFVHLIWGGGLLAQWGVLDFAGGIVVHDIAGFAALASVLYVGRRHVPDEGPHSVPFVALGTALLWFGWFGFNAGSEFRVDAVTAVAFINTELAAAFAAITWLAMGWWLEKRPSFGGIMIGAVVGLATITPAAGYVSPTSAVLIGIIASLVCYFAIVLKNRLRWDDALDVWGVHGVGGALGTILLGVFATKAFNVAGSNGAIHGNPAFFGKEIAAAVFAAVWSFTLSYGMLWAIDYCTTVRVTPASEESGLDQALHGETAYIVWPSTGSIGQ